MPRGEPRAGAGQTRLAWMLLLPALGLMALVTLFPLIWTLWESLHRHDLRMPWLGRPFVGLANYVEALGDSRLLASLVHTVGFTAVSVALELGLGLCLALAMHRAAPGRWLVRTTVLVPWALPTVVSALLWRFMFEGESGLANAILMELGLIEKPVIWLIHPLLAWVPVILADVWKTTPFVALLILAALQQIDGELYQAARVDGAGPWQRFRYVTLPLLRPAILVALIFRVLDAFRVFDLLLVLTGGGPGSSTEPVALYTFHSLLQNLRFGYGSTLSVIVFALTFGLALAAVRLLGPKLGEASS